MRTFAVAALCFLAGSAAYAQLAAPAREIPLYEGVAPGSEHWNYPERAAGTPDKPQAQNIVRPVLLYYPAPRSSAVGTAIVIAPGGGFRTLMMSYEGVDVAQRFNRMGIDAFVLKYRTTYVDADGKAAAAGSGPQAGQNVRAIAEADGQEAVRLVRRRAAEFGVAANRIGIIGYSAGGAVTLATVYGPADCTSRFRDPDLRRRRRSESAAVRRATAIHRGRGRRSGRRLPGLH